MKIEKIEYFILFFGVMAFTMGVMMVWSLG